MLRKLKFSIVFILLLASHLTLASWDDLENSRTRPTIADVEREVLSEVLSQPVPLTFGHTLDSMLPAIASLIAELEKVYPGSVYMPLGRDVVFTGDVIDAFFRSQGQTGRVLRLNSSGQSLGVEKPMIARFVQSSGVDIKNLASGPGYIIFDVSNYHLPDRSQSTKILSAVYQEYVRLGGQAKDIVRKFAFFNLHHGSSSRIVDNTLNPDEFFRKQSTYLEANPSSIPSLALTAQTALRGQSEWHAEFALLQQMPDGSVMAPPPLEPFAISTRQNILQEMKMALVAVRQPQFIELVQKRANELGYEFKLKKQSCDGSLK